MNVGNFTKEPYDEFEVAINYDDVIADGETITAATGTVQAYDVADDTESTSDVLANTGGPPPLVNLVTGTATTASATTLQDSAKNFAQLGIRVGDKIYNSTKKAIAEVKTIITTTNPFDTVTFDTQSPAWAASDAYAFRLVKASVKAGADGETHRIVFSLTTSASRKFQDSILMKVTDE